MDAQIAADPPVADHTPEPRARLSREPEEPSAERAFSEERAEPRVRLPGERSAQERFGECSEEPPLTTGGLLSEPTPNRRPPDDEPGVVRDSVGARRMRWWKRRQILLVGAVVIALGAAGAGAFLVSPYSRIYPAPQMASTIRHWAAEAGIELPEPLAPAASLADVPVSSAEPVVREKYQPKKKDAQLQELLGFRESRRVPESSPNEGQPQRESATPAVTPAGNLPVVVPASVAPEHDRSTSGRDEPPPGYVPSEPGSRPLSPPAVGGAEPPTEAAAASSASASQSLVAAAPRDATAAIVASLPKPAETTSSSPMAQPPAAVATGAEAPPPASPGAASSPGTSAADPVKTAGELRPAPLAPQEQVQVLELVTQIAAMVRDLRAQDAQLRVDFGKAAAENAARIGDFERRLALAEARHAVSAARDAGESPPAFPTEQTPGHFVPGVEAHGAGSSSATSVPAPPPPPSSVAAVPVRLTRAETAVGRRDQDAIKRYRVQAASPGLALLAEIDRGGGDGAQRQVLVGDTIPGYGRIKAIGQRGTAWVVETEHGNIQ
jgi:hypothetical protein